jgi:hypothetical protein
MIANKHLSILLQRDGFSFYISGKNEEEQPIVETLSFDLHNATPQVQTDFLKHSFLENEHLVNNTFTSVHVAHANNLSTFVPKAFFKEENIGDYLKFNIKVLQNDFIVHDIIEGAEMINVYIPFVYLNNFLFDKFGSFEYRHSSSVLVASLLKKNTSKDESVCYVNVENGFFQIVVIKNNKLVLYNAFDFKTKEDFIYFILFTAEQLEMNPDTFKLYLSGQIDKESVLYKMVYTYVRNVHFLETTAYLENYQNFILLNIQS